ncbi:type II secretion system minor pseudopilin GspI [Pseudomonas sp. 681]|uniref:Type II secretion system protein I n=1 Tax=Pseudomonas fungipugnans TaxID=3024217 RepID=A0ABT6QR23_9PSED|nr:type II secretion system minor pseudopilin GspI [Pseudomonas sp. 681]MDI2593349.1 type II secretion system minor pseudopilin GspI [Pseudomonas sp. 681]
MKTERGFTLLEVMIALAIFATLAAAVLSASQYVLKQGAGLEERLFASWLADNQLSELSLQHNPSIGRQQFVVAFAQRDWALSQVIRTAEDPRLLEVEISVRPVGSDQIVNQSQRWLQARDE